MVFYVISRYKLDALESGLDTFISDDLVSLIQSSQSKISSEDDLLIMVRANPEHIFKYRVVVDKCQINVS